LGLLCFVYFAVGFSLGVGLAIPWIGVREFDAIAIAVDDVPRFLRAFD